MSTATLRANFSRFAGATNEGWADPFIDIAGLSQPTNFRNALYWAEWLWSSQGTYRMAMERTISYFLTEIDVLKASDDEEDKWKTYLNETLDVLTVLQKMWRDRLCFHGDTLTTTKDGVFKLRDLTGKTVEVLSEGSVYRPATFKSFGRQKLLEVEFSDGRTVLATPEHEWVIHTHDGSSKRVPTKYLKHRRVPRVVALRPERNYDFREGVRHGFVFGDGSLYNEGEQAAAYFYGEKDEAMLRYFEGHGRDPRRHDKRVVIHGLPAHYKTLPENNCSASYWYGFVCGFLAADGTVDTHGCALLTQKTRVTLEIIGTQLARIGMVAGPIRKQRRIVRIVQANGSCNVYDSEIHFVTLLKQFMQPADFLIPKHRIKFEKNFRPSKYGEYIRVRDVRETNIVDEVFCCVEPQTHTFCINNGLLTGNCYGNGYASMIVPFKRMLACPKCGSRWTISEIWNTKQAFNFSWEMPNFIASCPACKVGSGYRGKFLVDDKPDDQEKKISVRHWSPHEIEMVFDPWTHESRYLWRIPEDYKRQLRVGYLFHLERAPMSVINAVHQNQLFLFNQDALFHMKDPTLSGLFNRGYGIPRIITNWRQMYYVQVLRRYQEAIAMDYVIPFRIITPAPRVGSGMGVPGNDPFMAVNGGESKNQILAMIRRRRRDPGAIQVLPFPVQFQMFGADANKLAPRDLLDQGTETLLNEIGTPVELYNGSIQLQAAPVGLRLYESTHHTLVHDGNAFLRWLVIASARILSWEIIEAALKRVTIADNIEKQMAVLQMYASQLVSGTTALGALGLNWKSEQKQTAEEAQIQAELQAKTQEEMEQSAQGKAIASGQAGAPGQAQGQAQGQGGEAGGDPSMMQQPGPVTQYLSSMSPNTPQSPQDMLAAADQMANDLLGKPESTKDSELRQLKQHNEVLHDMVRAKMDEKREKAQQQGGAQVMQQTYGR